MTEEEKYKSLEYLIDLKNNPPDIMPTVEEYFNSYKGNNMEKMTEREALLDCIFNELHEIKSHLCNQRHFEGGVGLGALMNLVSNGIYQEQEKRKQKKNEKIQEQGHNKEREKSTKEEDPNSEIAKKRMQVNDLHQFLLSLIRFRACSDWNEYIFDILRQTECPENEIKAILDWLNNGLGLLHRE